MPQKEEVINQWQRKRSPGDRCEPRTKVKYTAHPGRNPLGRLHGSRGVEIARFPNDGQGCLFRTCSEVICIQLCNPYLERRELELTSNVWKAVIRTTIPCTACAAMPPPASGTSSVLAPPEISRNHCDAVSDPRLVHDSHAWEVNFSGRNRRPAGGSRETGLSYGKTLFSKTKVYHQMPCGCGRETKGLAKAYAHITRIFRNGHPQRT